MKCNHSAWKSSDAPSTPQLPELKAALEMKLSSELRESVNKKMDVALKGDFAKVDADVLSSSNTFTAEQDKQLQIAIDETAKANQEAQQEQEKKISSAETEVEKEKQAALTEQQRLSQEALKEIGSEQTTQRTQMQSELDSAARSVESEFKKADQESNKLRSEAENTAAKEKEKAEKDDSWWGWVKEAANVVAEALAKFTSFLKKLYKEAQAKINSIIQKARDKATELIDKATSWVSEKLTSFQNWLQTKINELIAERFPKLAEKLNAIIDKLFEEVKQALTNIVNAVKNVIIKIADTTAKAISAALDIYKALELGSAALRGALTGNFDEFGELLLSSVLEIAEFESGIDATFGKSKETIQFILDNPDVFIKNVLQATKGGFEQFANNFPAHLKNGLIEWLTGSISGFKMPEKWDAKSVFTLTMNVMGWNKDWIKGKVKKLLGDDNMAIVEKVNGVVDSYLANGWEGIWDDHVGSVLDDISKSVGDAIASWLQVQVITKAVLKLATMFNPVAGIIQAIIIIEFRSHQR